MEIKKNSAHWNMRYTSALVISILAATPAMGQSSATYTYDALGRVVTVTDSTGTATYTYDAAGNRTRVVTAVNQPPAAFHDYVNVAPGGAITISVLTNDSDADGDAMSVVSVGTPTKGTAVILSNAIRYTATPGQVGPDSFIYTISDQRNGLGTANVYVSITPTNIVPVANPDSWSTAYGNSITGDPRLNDSDSDGDAISVVAVGTPAHGSTSFTISSVTYTPAAGYSGGDSFSYTISDGRNGTASASVSVNVAAPPNQAPIATNDAFTITAPVGDIAEGCVAVLANDSDPDGDALTITGFTQASTGTVYSSGNQLCYSVYAGNWTRTFTYTISDGRGGTATATVTVTIRLEL